MTFDRLNSGSSANNLLSFMAGYTVHGDEVDQSSFGKAIEEKKRESLTNDFTNEAAKKWQIERGRDHSRMRGWVHKERV